MADIQFSQLLNIYRHTDFDPTGDEGTLSIDVADVLADILAIEATDATSEAAGLAVLEEASHIILGNKVRIRASAPRLSLGILARDFDALLRAPDARIEERKHFYIIEGKIGSDDPSASTLYQHYKKTLDVITLLSESAAYFDKTRQELVYIKSGKFVVPISYDASALANLEINKADDLINFFNSEGHKEQKFEILSEAVVHLTESQPPANRTSYILNNISSLSNEISNGYKLFVSTFSYTKIRGELEVAKLAYVSQIHKTLVDIQGQLLGIPVATVIVASQMKANTTCDINLWTNAAVLGGAWVFLALLLFSIINQWLTLCAIRDDVNRQKNKLVSDFTAISSQFVDIFDGLNRRILWHLGGLIVIGIIAVAGAVFATVAFNHLNKVSLIHCVAGTSAKASAKKVTAPPRPTTASKQAASSASSLSKANAISH
jgi:hypothetical protein